MASCQVCNQSVAPIVPQVKVGAKVTHLSCFRAEHEREVRERVEHEARVKLEAEREAQRARDAKAQAMRDAEATIKREAEEAVRAKAHVEKAKADAAKLGIRSCVRCNKPGPHPAAHPGHCGPCWNSAAPVGVSKDAGKVPDMNRFGLIELE